MLNLLCHVSFFIQVVKIVTIVDFFVYRKVGFCTILQIIKYVNFIFNSNINFKFILKYN